MVCSNCGNDRYYGKQILKANVVVDQYGDFYRNLDSGLENAVYDAEKPRGPYICTRCGTTYQSLNGSITTICCNKKQTWEDRDTALSYFANCIARASGAEKTSYVKVYTSLKQGLNYCTDAKEINNRWI